MEGEINIRKRVSIRRLRRWCEAAHSDGVSSLEFGLGVEPEHDLAGPALYRVLDLELSQTLNLHTHTHTHTERK